MYERLRFSDSILNPKIYGENPIFPLLKGNNQTLTKRQIDSTPTIRFNKYENIHSLFYGAIILKTFRAWLILYKDKIDIPSNSEYIGQGVYAKFNPNEVFKSKVSSAKEDIIDNIQNLIALKTHLGCNLLLLYPVAISDNTYNRFKGTDRKYILTEGINTRKNEYPVIEKEKLCLISNEGQNFTIFHSPNDYLSDSFGILLEQTSDLGDPAILIKENSFSRNSKYIAIELFTNRLLDFTSIGKDDKLKERVEKLSTINEYENKLFLDKINELRISQKGHIGYLDSKVDTTKQIKLKEVNFEPECEYCMDEKYVNYSFNTRLYITPCKMCNSKQNDTWRAFDKL